jgi:hypothetical protein
MKHHVVSRQTVAAFAVGIGVAAGGMTLAQHTHTDSQKDSPHRHTGPVFGCVLEGEYQHALDNEPIQTFKAGETFYEPAAARKSS